MFQILKMKYILFAFLFISLGTNAQWIQTNGPYGSNSVSSLTRIPTGILAGSSNGMYFSSDEAANWQDYPFFQSEIIWQIASSGDTILIMHSPSNNLLLSRSEDGGNTWSVPLNIPTTIYGKKDFRKMGNNLLIATPDSIMKSNDNGISWTTAAPPNNRHVYQFDYYGKYNLLLQDSAGFIFYRYICDTALNFFSVNQQYTFRQMIMADSILFGEVLDTNNTHKIYKSSDFGLTFNLISTIFNTPIFSLFANGDSIYYRDSFNYYLSTDFGVTFNITPVPRFINFRASLPLLNGDELLITNSMSELVHYIPALDSFYTSYEGMRGMYTGKIYTDDTRLYSFGPFSLYRSSNGGIAWEKITEYFPSGDFIIKGDTLFTPSYNSLLSLDGGFTWDTISQNGIPNGTPRDVCFNNEMIFCNGFDYSYMTNDFGQNWTALPDLPASGPCGVNYSSAHDLCVKNNRLFAVTSDGMVFKLDSLYSSWSFVFCHPYNMWSSYGANIEVVGNKLIVTDSSMYISDDDGLTWQYPQMNGLPINSGYPSYGGKYIPTSLVESGGDLIGICGNIGIYYSYDNGNNWSPYPFSTNLFRATSLSVYNNVLFSGSSDKSVWYNSTLLSSKPPTKPENNFLIFPNPTKDYFSIKSEIDQKFNVSLFDNLGKKYFNLIDVSSDKQISIKDLPNGIYHILITDLENENPKWFKLIVVK